MVSFLSSYPKLSVVSHESEKKVKENISDNMPVKVWVFDFLHFEQVSAFWVL